MDARNRGTAHWGERNRQRREGTRRTELGTKTLDSLDSLQETGRGVGDEEDGPSAQLLAGGLSSGWSRPVAQRAHALSVSGNGGPLTFVPSES